MLSSYEKTIIEHVIAFGQIGTFIPERDDVVCLANLLNIDESIISRALKLDRIDFENEGILFEGEFFYPDLYSIPLIEIIIKYHFIISAVEKIVDDTSKETLQKNINCFKDAFCMFETMNVFLNTAEAQRKNKYSYDFQVFSGSSFVLRDGVDLLVSYSALLRSGKYSDCIKSKLRLLQIILKYNLTTCSNTLYLIAIAQLLSHSSFLDEEVICIAQDFYLNMITLLKNTRVISLKVNSLYQNVEKPFWERKKSIDNTTRLEIVYGFENFDIYTMRLDLAHVGQGFTHYNNISPGGVKCCLFNKTEYQHIMEEHPQLSTCFIQYGDRFALKERNNCNFYEVDKALYEMIRKRKEHEKVFEKIYSEKNICDFVSCVGKMLPYYCFTTIDKDGLHESQCYDYNRFMMDVSKLFQHIVEGDIIEEENYVNKIVMNAIKKNIIPEEDYELYLSIDGICDLVGLYFNRIK